jgi:hypothetical protein
MKNNLNRYLFIFLLLPLSMSASDILDNIAGAISSGNANALAQYFDNTVDITVVDKEAVYSKSQAQVVVQDFFSKNPVRRFTLIHRGSSAEGSSYGIGNFESGSQVFRVYYFVKLKNGVYFIQEMRFEKQK